MESHEINARIRRCDTLMQALLAVNNMALPDGRICIRTDKVEGIVDFQSNKVTAVTITGTNQTGEAALDVVVALKNARCQYLMPGAEPVADDGGNDQNEQAAPATPEKTATRIAALKAQLRAAVASDDLEDLLQRHKEEFEKTSGKLDYLQDETLEAEIQSGVSILARVGFLLSEGNNSPSLETALASCGSLLGALLAARSMGVKAGILELKSQDVKGTVEFRNRRLTKADIAQTGQTGEDALKILMALSDAVCKYSPFPEKQSKSDGLDLTSGLAGGSFSLSETAEHPLSAALRKKSRLASKLLPHQKRLNAEDDQLENEEPLDSEQKQKILEAQRAEFEQKDARLSDLSMPPHDGVQLPLTPTAFDTGESANRIAMALSRAGFVWDFRNVPLQASGPLQTGDPAAVRLAEVRISRTSRTMRKYVLPLVVAALCVSIFIVPGLLWQAAGSKDTTSKTQLQKMADSTYDNLDDGNGIMRSAFVMPAGSTGPLQAPPVSIVGESAADIEKAAENGKDPSDALEFSLADNAATLPRLEELIHRYIAQKKFRLARALALAGVRSNYATEEAKQRFFDLYRLCLNK